MTLILKDKIKFTPEVFHGSSPTSIKISLNSPQNDISKACQLWEEATDLLLEAGRIFSQVKADAKRNFPNLLIDTGLQKAQVDRLIKASTVAEEIPTVVARRLGINILAQLGQVKHQTILEAIEPTDNQISVAQKIKDNRPTKETSKEAVKFVGSKQKGTQRLRIEIPECQETQDIYQELKKSDLPPLEWLQNLRSKKQPTIKEILNQEASVSVIAMSEPWQKFPQSWQHEGKDCCYKVVDGERTICWGGNFETKVVDSLAAKYGNPRVFLDFELLTPGALVEINAKGSTWHGLQVYVQEISGSKAKVYLQESNKEIIFSINKLKILEPSLNSWKRIN